ncbi:MAG: Gfo/Idh/MocA family protein, partial [Bryobacteraceae bacterium]
MSKIRIALVGAGSFGRNHLRVLRESGRAELAAVVDTDPARAQSAAAQYGCQALSGIEDLTGNVEAAIVATPTTTHAAIGCELLEAGIDVLVEKPIAADPASARRLAETARRTGRILQVGHLERFNPAVMALERAVRLPLFFEIHRLSVFTPRSLDVDVVLDLMIHDIDIVLALTGRAPEEVRAAGICILSPKVDIANVRLEFDSGCVANLTASRISTERVRKVRFFQPRQYVSVDYGKQDLFALSVDENFSAGSFDPAMLAAAAADPAIPIPGVKLTRPEVIAEEPLHAELKEFLRAVRERETP